MFDVLKFGVQENNKTKKVKVKMVSKMYRKELLTYL